METYTVEKAQTSLNELLSEAHKGKTVLIAITSGSGIPRQSF